MESENKPASPDNPNPSSTPQSDREFATTHTAPTVEMTPTEKGENLPATGNATSVAAKADSAVVAPELHRLRPHEFASPPPVWTEPPRKKRFNWIFFLTVVVPTTIAIIYYGVIASDVFISESRFVVRSPQRQAQTGLSALLQGGGFARSQDDT